eukprot:TRINITY_DN7270_c0_g1_i1.p1 TRINITY_DN7270_c0_g1~~TRINITY_DN7270_c0_g1_i1.p1  ORF type:complete len:722 (+),score=197.87 TRINITY_DN7270_c0_g1_i1:33-2198(+)
MGNVFLMRLVLIVLVDSMRVLPRKGKTNKMTTTVHIDENGSVLIHLLNQYLNLDLDIQEGESQTEATFDGVKIVDEVEIAQKLVEGTSLVGGDDLQEQILEWINFAVTVRDNVDRFDLLVEDLTFHLKFRTYLVGYALTVADFVLYSVLIRLNKWRNVIKSNKKMKYKYAVRYMVYLETLPVFCDVVDMAEELGFTDEQKRVTTGTFDPLEGAVDGEVVVRFPPEPSGFLHIGHAKAAFTNDYYKRLYNGKLLLRFDDTNPNAEKQEYEDAIIKDLATMGIVPDSVSHTSQHFDLILSKAEEMIAIGKAYCDDADAETINERRLNKIPSPHRDNTVEENMKMWNELKAGTEYGRTCVLRAKIDMSSDNGTMRDPVIYRYLGIPHIKTGDKFLIYPIYNFACPIVDSIEGVTHACRSSEYHDSEEQYYWFLENIPGCRPVKIQDFSRLNFSHTLMSKRKLNWFVSEGHVKGWDDPRFPTIQGITRRGLSMNALRDFVIDLGNSKNAVLMDVNKLWAFNKQAIDPVIPRYCVVRTENAVTCELVDVNETETVEVLRCKLNEGLGNKQLIRSKVILLDQADVQTIDDNEEVTIMDWGNIILQGREKEGDNYTNMTAVTNLGGDFKKTKKITWISEENAVACLLTYYDPIITIPSVPKNEDFKNYVNFDSYHEFPAIGEAAIREVQVGDSIQFTRKGYFRLDEIREDGTYVFINIPDGHEKNVWK